MCVFVSVCMCKASVCCFSTLNMLLYFFFHKTHLNLLLSRKASKV